MNSNAHISQLCIRFSAAVDFGIILQMTKGPITAAQLLGQLEADPAWQAQRKAQERERLERQRQVRLEQALLLQNLNAAGVVVNDVWDLIGATEPYPSAWPILLDHLSHPYSTVVREGIARALAVKEARNIAWERLIELASNKTLEKRIADGMMVAISAMAQPSDLEELIALISDREIGSSRVFLVRNLMRSKNLRAREALLSLREDTDLRVEIAARLKTSSHP